MMERKTTTFWIDQLLVQLELRNVILIVDFVEFKNLQKYFLSPFLYYIHNKNGYGVSIHDSNFLQVR